MLLDIYNYLKSLNQKFKYCLIKTDTPYMTTDFPVSYPIGKDMDLLCCKEDYDNLVTHTILFFKNVPTTQKKIRRSKGNLLLRFTEDHSKKMHYQIDISWEFHSLQAGVIKSIVNNAVLNGNGSYYVTTEASEKQIRLEEIRRNPDKIHHHQWIQKHYPSE
jgi:hypothetical protein